MMKSAVLVTRKWHEPEIKVTVSADGIGIAMLLEDFLKAVANEAGNPTFWVTKAGVEKRVLVAAEKVISQMKNETARLV